MSIDQIIKNLVKSALGVGQETPDDYIIYIERVYAEKKHNIRSSIAESVLSNQLDPQSIDLIIGYLSSILDLAVRQMPDSEAIHAIEYFMDYLGLEKIHLNLLLSQQQSTSELRTRLTNATSEVQEAIVETQQSINNIKQETLKEMQATLDSNVKRIDERVEKAQDDIRSLDVHSVTVLGIFTAITFAFSGSFTLIGSALTDIQDFTLASALLLISVICLIGCIIFNGICVIIWGLSKFLDKKVVTTTTLKLYQQINTALIIVFLVTFLLFALVNILSIYFTSQDLSTVQNVICTNSDIISIVLSLHDAAI